MSMTTAPAPRRARRPRTESRAPRGDLFADGMSAARRPTGPIVAILAVLGAFSVGHVVFALPLSLLLGPAADDSTSVIGQLMVNVVPFTGALLALWAWIRFREQRRFATIGFVGNPRRALLGAAVGFGMIATAVAIGVVTGQFAVTAHPVGGAAIGALLVALFGYLVQGGTEEVLFRGFLLQAGIRRWGLTAGVLLQAILFAALHGINPGGLAMLPLLNLFLFAIFLAVWALREGSLWVTCLWHAMWNFTQGPIAGIHVSGEQVGTSLLDTATTAGSRAIVTGGAFGLEGGLLTTLVLVTGLIVLTLARRGRTCAPSSVLAKH